MTKKTIPAKRGKTESVFTLPFTVNAYFSHNVTSSLHFLSTMPVLNDLLLLFWSNDGA